MTNENNRCSTSIASYCNPEGDEETFNKLHKLLDLRSKNEIELHVKEIEKRGTRIEIENSGNNLAGFDHFKSEVFADLERKK